MRPPVRSARFQVVVPGLGTASTGSTARSRRARLDLPVSERRARATGRPGAAAGLHCRSGASPAGPCRRSARPSVRPQFLAGANLALLAAATIATIYLWLRVFGADAGPFSFAGGECVGRLRSNGRGRRDRPHARPGSGPSPRTPSAAWAPPAGEPLRALPRPRTTASTTASNRSKKRHEGRNGGPVVPARPTRADAGAALPADPEPNGPGADLPDSLGAARRPGPGPDHSERPEPGAAPAARHRRRAALGDSRSARRRRSCRQPVSDALGCRPRRLRSSASPWGSSACSCSATTAPTSFSPTFGRPRR